jgi:hypothetical protein
MTRREFTAGMGGAASHWHPSDLRAAVGVAGYR